jgi:hypothetical protein
MKKNKFTIFIERIPIAVLKLESVSVIQREIILIFSLFSIVYKTFLVSILLLSIKSNTILKNFCF